MRHVRALASRPRPPGSPRHRAVRERLLDGLDRIGLLTAVDSAVAVRGETLTASVRNVVGRLPGRGGGAHVLLMAHYDSRPLTPGAGDDATGVATVLETVRALAAGPPRAGDVTVLLTDAEEAGLLGARSAVERGPPWLDSVDVVLNFEMRGAGGRSLLFETGRDNEALMRAAIGADPSLVASSLYDAVYRRMPNDTDFTPFRERGLPGLNFAGIGRPTRYHHPSDTPGNLDPATLQDHGNHALRIARAFAGRSPSELRAGGDAVFHTLSGIGTVVHGVRWIPVQAGLVVLLFAAAAVWLGRREERGWTALGLGALLGAVSVAFGALAGLGVRALGRALRPEWGRLHGAAAWGEEPLFLALVLATVATVLGLLAFLARGPSVAALSLGAAFPALAGGLALAALAPLGAMVLLWPVGAAVAGAVLATLLPRSGRARRLRGPALALPALAAAWILSPLVHELWTGLGLSAAAVLGGVAALALTLFLPLLAEAARPLPRLAPGLALAVAVAALLVAAVERGPSPERPLPSALLHLEDRESGEALWAVPPLPRPAHWAAVLVDASPEALSPVVDRFLPGRPPRHWTGPAPRSGAPAPELEVAPVEGASGRWRLSVRSRAGAETLVLRPVGADPARVEWRAVEGRPLEPGFGGAEELLVHIGEPLGGTLELELEVLPAPGPGPGPGAGSPAAGPLRIELVEHHLRPEELLGDAWPRRPPHLAPDLRATTDRSLLRSEIDIADGSG